MEYLKTQCHNKLFGNRYDGCQGKKWFSAPFGIHLLPGLKPRFLCDKTPEVKFWRRLTQQTCFFLRVCYELK